MNDDMIERWLPIPLWEGLYDVSDKGRVRSLTRTFVIRDPKGVLAPRTYRGRILTPGVTPRGGYFHVSLTAPGRVKERAYVHDLVLLAFVGHKPRGLEVCHRDDVSSNCALTNLRYDTRVANAADKKANGRENPPRGEESVHAILTEADVREIRRLRPGTTLQALADKYGVHNMTIHAATTGKSWKHVA